MTYYFDNWGWLTEDAIQGRSTEVAPPDPATIPEGHRPNFTGHVWVVRQYVAPPSSTIVSVPRSVTRRQMKLALHRNGTLPAITQYVDSSDDIELQIWFHDSQVFERSNEVMNQHLPTLGISPQQADDLFIYAKGL